MASIITVSGPVEAGTFTGPVLSHEHLAIDLRTESDPAGFLHHHEMIAGELRRLRAEMSLSLVVDQTCRGMGRNVNALAALCKDTGVDIVAATGWYYGKFHPSAEPGKDVGQAEEILEVEVTCGLDGTAILPGLLGEIGTHGLQPTPAEEVSLRACGKVASRHDLPLATHAHLGTGAGAQLEILESSGMDLTRVVIGHQDLTENTQQHVEIIGRGAYVGFDTVGKESYQRDEVRMRSLLTLLDRGLGERVVLSNDISRYHYLAARGGQGYGHVLTRFAQRLREAGLDDDTIDLLYRRNPLRWLSGEEVS